MFLFGTNTTSLGSTKQQHAKGIIDLKILVGVHPKFTKQGNHMYVRPHPKFIDIIYIYIDLFPPKTYIVVMLMRRQTDGDTRKRFFFTVVKWVFPKIMVPPDAPDHPF